MADTPPLAELVHAIPGRARLRIAARRGDAVFFASIATALSHTSGVADVEVRPLTASIVIRHAGPLSRIGDAARDAGLFVISTPVAAPPPVCAIPVEPRIVAAVGLGTFALWQLTQGRILPPALTLAWYAAHLGGMLASGEAASSE